MKETHGYWLQEVYEDFSARPSARWRFDVMPRDEEVHAIRGRAQDGQGDHTIAQACGAPVER